MTRMGLILTLTVCFVFLVSGWSFGQDTEKVTFHVSSVRSGETQDLCGDGTCSSKKFTVEGYTSSAEYVLECMEVLANKPSPHFTVVCPKLHAHGDYNARLGADYIAFGDGKKLSDNEPMLSSYSIVSEKETAKHRQ
jgi:hypothetical protein